MLQILKDIYHFVRERLFNYLRSLFWKIMISLYSFKWPARLHLGCGNTRLDGYLNVDMKKTKATDLVCDVRNLPFKDGAFELIENYHVIEHLQRHDLKPALLSWHKLLKPGGRLIMEYPDFDQDVKDYLAGNEERLDSIFGKQRYEGDTHYFGYNFKRLKALLEECGFKDIENTKARDYHTQTEPCLRIECVK